MHCNFTMLDLSNFLSGRNENIFSQINSGFVISKMNVLQTSRLIALFFEISNLHAEQINLKKNDVVIFGLELEAK